MSKICSFFGHRDLFETHEIACEIKSKIIDCIEHNGIDIFYLGGKDKFDYACAKYIKEIK